MSNKKGACKDSFLFYTIKNNTVPYNLLNCAIIDDDRLFTRLIEHYMTDVNAARIVGVYNNSVTALNTINFAEIDLLYLNVEMPGMTGLEFLRSLSKAPPVIFVSGKKIYGADAFEYNAIDYLHKPVSQERFLKSISKARSHFDKLNISDTSNQKYLFIKYDRMHIRLCMDDIHIVRANDNDVSITTNGKTYKTHVRLKDLQEMLPQKQFMRVHRSFIVQLSKIDKVDGEVIEINGRTIPVSKTYLKELYERLKIKSSHKY